METGELRKIVVLASGGRGLWPNHLGFDRGGWSYAPDNATGATWYASRESDEKHGSGATPEAAKANALAPRRVRDAVLAIQHNADGRPCGWGISASREDAEAEAARQYAGHACYPGEELGELTVQTVATQVGA